MITVIALEATDLASPAPGRGRDSTHTNLPHSLSRSPSRLGYGQPCLAAPSIAGDRLRARSTLAIPHLVGTRHASDTLHNSKGNSHTYKLAIRAILAWSTLAEARSTYKSPPSCGRVMGTAENWPIK